MANCILKQIELPLKVTWAISRNATDIKRNFVVELLWKDRTMGRGEVAFNVRYGESLELVQQQFDDACQGDAWWDSCDDLEQFCQQLDQRKLCSSLRFGMESAFVHALAYDRGQGVSELLGVPPISGGVETSFSIPICL